MIRFDRLISFVTRTVFALFALGIAWECHKYELIPKNFLLVWAGFIAGVYVAKLKE